MFTGLIEEIVTLQEVRPFPGGRRLSVRAAGVLSQMERGDSVALNGVCLTVEALDRTAGLFEVTAVEETVRRTTAGDWRRGRNLHLEQALAAGGRLGGHLVQGHVDGVARVVRIGRERREFVYTLALPSELRRYVVVKGSITVDGVSLTVGDLSAGRCRIFIIPETLARTLIGSYRAGERVNIEVDLVAKYVESLLIRKGTW